MNLAQWTQQTYDTLRARRYARRTYTKDEVQEILRTAVDILVDELAEEGDLALADLGRLWVETRKPRTIHSSLEGQPTTYEIGARKRVVFRMSERLKKTLNRDGAE
ncbi:MAG: HU family DNA-binding protein [Anaerolineae bacterium]|nr:HU family DNA-binding protein [Anaerolineae bacterium]